MVFQFGKLELEVKVLHELNPVVPVQCWTKYVLRRLVPVTDNHVGWGGGGGGGLAI